MVVVAVPVSALVARNVTGNEPSSLVRGVQVNVPLVLEVPAVNLALLVAGNRERSAVSDWIASPSGSAAETETDTCVPATTFSTAGTVTTGAWSPIVNESNTLPRLQVMSFLLLPESPAGPQIASPWIALSEM